MKKLNKKIVSKELCGMPERISSEELKPQFNS